MLGEIAMAVLALAGIAIAAASIAAAVSARGTRHELENGTLSRVEDRLIGQDKRLERMESKVDRAHARINDRAEVTDQRLRRLEERS